MRGVQFWPLCSFLCAILTPCTLCVTHSWPVYSIQFAILTPALCATFKHDPCTLYNTYSCTPALISWCWGLCVSCCTITKVYSLVQGHVLPGTQWGGASFKPLPFHRNLWLTHNWPPSYSPLVTQRHHPPTPSSGNEFKQSVIDVSHTRSRMLGWPSMDSPVPFLQ